MAAFSGRRPSGIGAAGRAMLLSSAEAASIGIALKSNSILYISISDQMGNTMLKGTDKIIPALKQAGVREKHGAEEVRSLGLETLRLPK
jgi:hypothetical protein